ncbi:MAG: M48 family metalloprotease [Myxococcales bacterium]
MRIPICCLLAFACVRNPATGKLQLDLVSSAQEVQMGQDAKKQVEEQMGLYKDPKLEPYVANLGKQLATATGADFPFSYEIVDDSSVNAFALPGGPIFVNRGLLAHIGSEAQLAAVLGHETGHVVAHHSANQMSKQELAQIGLAVGSAISPTIASLGQAAGAGLQLLFLKYSRDDETQADELGFRYMTKAGYDPHQMLDLFHMLDGLTKESPGGKTPQWLQTHPDPGNRTQATEQRLKTELTGDTSGLKVNRDPYMQVIDGIVIGDDPRQGFFKGDMFFHPVLKWQMKFPAGWLHQNTPSAVAAASQKQDAILEVASAGKISPDEAAQKLFSQQGVQAGQPASVHGAKLARQFAATTQQGAIEGIAAFVPYQGTTYMMVGYTPQGGLAAYGNTFVDSMGSFGELTDSSAANAQPARLKIVHLDAPLWLADFKAKFPSPAAKDQTLALINGVAGGGQIQPGFAKQVVGGTGEPQ